MEPREPDSPAVPLRRRDGSVRAWCLVDEADLEWASRYRWHLSTYEYASRSQRIDGRVRVFSMHRELLGLAYGDGREVDHINRDRLDNRRSNLRLVTRSENCRNRIGMGKSRHRGVTWDGRADRWKVMVSVDGSLRYVGRFRDEEVAAKAAEEYREKHGV